MRDGSCSILLPLSLGEGEGGVRLDLFNVVDRLPEFLLQQLSQSDTSPRLLDEIVVKSREVIEEISRARLQEVGTSQPFVAIGIDDDADTFFLDMHIYVLSCHGGITIKVNYARHLTVNRQVLGAECLDARALVKRLAEHVDGDLRSLKNVERLHNHHVHQSVAHRCLRSNIGVVAILRGVGTGDQKRFIALRTRVSFNI